VSDAPAGCAAGQRDVGRLEKWADTNLLKFNKGKSQAIHLGGSNPKPHSKLLFKWLGNGFAEKDLWVEVDTKLTMSQQRALQQRNPTASWAALGREKPAG